MEFTSIIADVESQITETKEFDTKYCQKLRNYLKTSLNSNNYPSSHDFLRIFEFFKTFESFRSELGVILKLILDEWYLIKNKKNRFILEVSEKLLFIQNEIDLGEVEKSDFFETVLSVDLHSSSYIIYTILDLISSYIKLFEISIESYINSFQIIISQLSKWLNAFDHHPMLAVGYLETFCLCIKDRNFIQLFVLNECFEKIVSQLLSIGWMNDGYDLRQCLNTLIQLSEYDFIVNHCLSEENLDRLFELYEKLVKIFVDGKSDKQEKLDATILLFHRLIGRVFQTEERLNLLFDYLLSILMESLASDQLKIETLRLAGSCLAKINFDKITNSNLITFLVSRLLDNDMTLLEKEIFNFLVKFVEFPHSIDIFYLSFDLIIQSIIFWTINDQTGRICIPDEKQFLHAVAIISKFFLIHGKTFKPNSSNLQYLDIVKAFFMGYESCKNEKINKLEKRITLNTCCSILWFSLFFTFLTPKKDENYSKPIIVAFENIFSKTEDPLLKALINLHLFLFYGYKLQIELFGFWMDGFFQGQFIDLMKYFNIHIFNLVDLKEENSSLTKAFESVNKQLEITQQHLKSSKNDLAKKDTDFKDACILLHRAYNKLKGNID
eukprot:TRINITY_DN1899_c0_g1_i1.p1 TRINITY_DN1899_c0_g1~~TRINITY_DN1899_c0_g1_i1.p1  ORF type:complete len:610 (-),score=172.37 TRINITY_DN1899_c0_g1_i1:15-1844(-)